MPDREKVIKGLERCELYNKLNCDKCPYDYNGRGNGKSECTAELVTDALTLLKEQEAKTGHWIYLQYCANEGVYCSECHTKMFDRYPMKKKLSQFCGHCGAKMEEQVMLE